VSSRTAIDNRRAAFRDGATVVLVLALVVGGRFVGVSVRAVADHVQSATPEPAIWQGVFTKMQAARGKDVFEAECASCHGGGLAEAPPLTADPFLRNWEGHHLDRLFTKIRDEMPPGSAHTVSPERKRDVLAYILSENGFPPGDEELPADSEELALIQIVPKGGPAPLRTGATVQVVGCLEHHGASDWVLTNSSEPAATSLSPQTDAELSQANAQPLGTAVIRLLSVFPSPVDKRGHRVEAKGFLIRKGGDVALNIALLRSIAPTCP
jgi:quinoprotein glucose dehydrogenase